MKNLPKGKAVAVPATEKESLWEHRRKVFCLKVRRRTLLLRNRQSGAMAPPIPSAQSPRFPVKPLKIVGALPDEFYPVELDGDLFASEPDQDEPEDDKRDH
ncbi:MAG: hypothetical protein MZV70_38330 [Desulfobacterales bacterium]|nr:hypothetical protein [Desulfobacterales bacterium]